MLFIVVITALLLDQILGEPRRFHPLVGFGYLANIADNRFNAFAPTRHVQQPSLSIIKGGIAVLILIVPFLILSFFIARYMTWSWVVDIIVLYWAIGHQSLREHVLTVFKHLLKNDQHASRTALSMIVSRNTEKLDQTQITQATIETALENGSDAIFAPIFWFCLLEITANLGSPAVIAYRLINTLDAMWGYRNKQYLYFGRFAARLDDVLNYIPARLVALSYTVLGNTALAIHCWRKQSGLLNSPNAGPVMTSGAGSLNVRLGGPTYYHGSYTEKPYFGSDIIPTIPDIKRSLDLIRNTLYLWVLAIAFISLCSLFFSS
ncbi:MAG: adenosylcobinamide-phosphate synthase CbiB [Arenicella sp.]